MTENGILDAMKTLLKPINNKLEDLDLKLESLRLENKIEHRTIRGDIERLNDEMETVVEALRAKNILPIAK